MTLRRFFRTPKGLLLLVLSGLCVAAALGDGVGKVLPGVAAAVVAAVAIDLPTLRWRHRRWEFPDGAILTALIVAMVLSPEQRWYVFATTSAVAIAGKYLFRAGKANVFNPAAFGLVATFYLFDTGQSWWGALPDLMPAAIAILIAAGIFIAITVNKVVAVVSFLLVYFGIATVMAFTGSPAGVAELFRTPDLHAALYFAFFMVTDPPTSPPRPRDQVIYAVIAATVGSVVLQVVGAAYYLLAGVLAANIWEALRRNRVSFRRSSQRASSGHGRGYPARAEVLPS